jgi:hypothetical protein
METQKDLHMWFHTSLRNVGLFTSVSFGALAYSRVYREKRPIYNLFLILASIIFMMVSLMINWYLIQNYEIYQKKIQSSSSSSSSSEDAILAFVPRIVFVFNVGILGLGVSTFIREWFS